jgi:hypothetical protein
MCDANADLMRFTKNKDNIHSTGAEGYVSGYIANRIFSESLLVDGEYVDYVRLEANVVGHLDLTSEGRKTGRFDIMCFDEADNAILIVEVKRYFSPSALKEDAARLVSAIVKSRSAERHLRGAVLLGASTDWGGAAKTTAEQQLEQVEASIRNYQTNIHTWGGIHEARLTLEGESALQKVTGFAVLIKG